MQGDTDGTYPLLPSIILDDDDCCVATVGDFEFAKHEQGLAQSQGGEAIDELRQELFVASCIHIGCLS